MSSDHSLIAAGLFGLAGLFTGWRGARPPDFKRGPRMMPWRWITLLCLVAVLLLLHQAFLGFQAK